MNNPKQLTFPWNKDNKSSFDNFYVTKSNKQLLLTLQDEIFNDDLLIFGTKDSGKTFLLQALCNLYDRKRKSAFFLPIKQAIELSVDILDSLENIDLGNELEQKTEVMRGISKEFSIRSKKVKRRIWYRNARVNICLLFLVSGLFYYIYNSIN